MSLYVVCMYGIVCMMYVLHATHVYIYMGMLPLFIEYFSIIPTSSAMSSEKRGEMHAYTRQCTQMHDNVTLDAYTMQANR